MLEATLEVKGRGVLTEVLSHLIGQATQLGQVVMETLNIFLDVLGENDNNKHHKMTTEHEAFPGDLDI